MLDTSVLSVLMLLAVLVLVITNYYFQKRQAVALEGSRHATEGMHMLQIRKDREGIAQKDLVPDITAWVKENAAKSFGYPFNLDGKPTVYKNVQSALYLMANGDKLVVSTLDKKTLINLTKVSKKTTILESSDKIDLFGANPRKAIAKERNMINSGEYFDLETAQVGEKLKANWATPERLYFYHVAG